MQGVQGLRAVRGSQARADVRHGGAAGARVRKLLVESRH